MTRNKYYYISMVTTIIAIMCLFGCFTMFGTLQRNKDIVKAYKEHYCPYCGELLKENEE